MSVDNLRALARVMAPGAELRLATDIPAYVEHGLLAAEQVPEFRFPRAGLERALGRVAQDAL